MTNVSSGSNGMWAVLSPQPSALGPAGALHQHVEGLQVRGHAWALHAGVLSPRPEDELALSALAGALAQATGGMQYEPERQAADRHRDSMFAALSADARRLSASSEFAAARMRTDAAAAARAESVVGDRPPLPPVPMLTSACVIAITLAPTLHDFVFATLSDDLANWMLSILFGILVGVMIVWGLFAGEFEPTLRSKAALASGVLVGVGFAVLRFSQAAAVSEAVFALGLSLMEVGTIALIDSLAARHRVAAIDWRTRSTTAAAAQAGSRAATAEHERIASNKRNVDDRIQSHLRYMDARREMSGDSREREDMFVRAILAGYHAGIADNIGRTQMLTTIG